MPELTRNLHTHSALSFRANDGIHPNAKGVARMVAGILPLVERLIAAAADGTGKARD